MSLSPISDTSLRVRPVSQLTPRQVVWLWQYRLALGKLALLEGDPGLGKSLVALDLCARLSTGRPFPDGTPGPAPASAIVLNGEDGAEDTVRPRLQALGADMERVFIVDRTGPAFPEPLLFPTHLALLDEALTRTRASLVVIDPIKAFLHPGIVESIEPSVRRALGPLAQLADKHACVMLLHRHLNKSRGSQSLYRGGGSIAFLALCRSGWLIAPDPQQPKRRILAQVKNNLAAPQPSLAFAVQGAHSESPLLSWQGPCAQTANQLLEAAKHPRILATPRERAQDFLAAALEAGPLTSRELWALAQEQGLSERTLHRARQVLEIRCVRVCVDGKPRSYWLLPGQQLPADLPPDAAPHTLEEWLEPLRKEFPPSTPLDDL
jgi:RecA-family ATPase